MSGATFRDPREVVPLMSAGHPWLTFVATPPPLTWALANLRGEWSRGGDPTRLWRRRLASWQQETYAADIPERVASALVLQWLLGVLAETTVRAATSGPWLADLDTVSFDLAPTHYPDRVGVASVLADERPAGERLEAAHAAYRQAAERVVTGYVCEARFGAHQRQGMARDAWELAVHAARGGAPGQVARVSCCYVYVLPGCYECAGCPRLRRQPA